MNKYKNLLWNWILTIHDGILVTDNRFQIFKFRFDHIKIIN